VDGWAELGLVGPFWLVLCCACVVGGGRPALVAGGGGRQKHAGLQIAFTQGPGSGEGVERRMHGGQHDSVAAFNADNAELVSAGLTLTIEAIRPRLPGIKYREPDAAFWMHSIRPRGFFFFFYCGGRRRTVEGAHGRLFPRFALASALAPFGPKRCCLGQASIGRGLFFRVSRLGRYAPQAVSNARLRLSLPRDWQLRMEETAGPGGRGRCTVRRTALADIVLLPEFCSNIAMIRSAPRARCGKLRVASCRPDGGSS